VTSLATAVRDATRVLRVLEDTARALQAAIDEARALEAQPGAEPSRQTLMLTVEDAALELGVSRTTVYELIRSGQLASVKVGTLRRIRATDLATYAASLGT
jgi:excisionase family DNA binding protein